jgi:hypothetical protein
MRWQTGTLFLYIAYVLMQKIFYFQTQFITLTTMMFFIIILPATNSLYGRLVEMN